MSDDKDFSWIVAITAAHAAGVLGHATIDENIAEQCPDVLGLDFGAEENAGANALAAMRELQLFARSNAGAPSEALYRFAQGRGFHNEDPHGFWNLPYNNQLAYELFFRVIVAAGQAKAAVDAVARSTAGGPAAAPPLATALLEDPEDTILEQHPDPLATNPNMVLRREGEPVAADENKQPLAGPSAIDGADKHGVGAESLTAAPVPNAAAEPAPIPLATEAPRTDAETSTQKS